MKTKPNTVSHALLGVGVLITEYKLTAPERAALAQYWAALDQIRTASGQTARRKR
jgi:hypothetical protein